MKKKLVSHQERDAPARVTGHRDREQVRGESHRLAPGELALDLSRARSDVVRVHHALAPEASPDRLVVGDVVPVGQEERLDPAELGEPFEQRTRGPRRVDEHVAVGALDQVARGAERLLRRVAAVKDALRDRLGERPSRDARVILRLRADRARGASDESHGGAQRLALTLGLAVNVGHAAPVRAPEGRGRQLAARVAVDTGRVHEEVAGDVLGEALALPGHDSKVAPERPRALREGRRLTRRLCRPSSSRRPCRLRSCRRSRSWPRSGRRSPGSTS